jgi:replicative DNA helicase
MISKVQNTVTEHTEHDDQREIDHVGEIAKTLTFKAGGSRRIPTGLTAIDDIIIGICKTDYVVVAGRPGMGKTALMLDIAVNVSWGNGFPCAFYSCEMSPEQLTSRMASSRSGIPLYNVEKGFAKPDEIEMLKEAARQMQTCPLYIKSTGGLTPMALKRKISADKRKYNIKMAFVDYLQLMQPDGQVRSGYENITNI